MARKKRESHLYRGYTIVDEEDGTINLIKGFTEIKCDSILEAYLKIDELCIV